MKQWTVSKFSKPQCNGDYYVTKEIKVDRYNTWYNRYENDFGLVRFMTYEDAQTKADELNSLEIV